MKVTSRELTLLIALLSVAVIYLLYTFLFNPLLGDISIAKDELDVAKAQQVQVEENRENLPSIKKQQEELAIETDKLVAKFLPGVQDDTITTFFAMTTSKGGPGINGLYFDDLEAVNLDTLHAQPYVGVTYPYGNWAAKVKDQAYIPAPADSPAASEEQNNTTVLSQGVTVEFINSGYEQAIAQMKAVEALDRAIIIDSLSIIKGESGTLDGMIHYSFYGVDKLTDKDKGIAKTNLTDPNGKTNPFN